MDIKRLGRKTKTSRGFEIIHFQDRYGIECSLQQSSLADNDTPGTSAIWLGCGHANPRVLVQGKGWKPVPMPPEYIADTRMHLDRTQVVRLINHLQKWLKTGKL